ncbi:MAG: right-handed parallel beta-helix repeat-containing protein [Sphingobacteriaceae bacterium]|nr:MAG: right-handed parallel beta-helix repeat-containing protein [Sphingobacteriaceae bacterium]
MALYINHHPVEINQKENSKTGCRSVCWNSVVGFIPPTNKQTLSANEPAAAKSNHFGNKVISLNGVHNIEIKGKTITGVSQSCITLTNCSNIRITNCSFVNGRARGIYLYNCQNITIENNFFNKVVSGVLADHCKGGIVVNHNQFLNMTGPMPGGQYVQFNTVEGANCSVSYNKGENILGEGKPEDCINLYQSRGTMESPIKVMGNWIRGGGPSGSGGGIMLGDNGGAYQIAENNILVNPGEYGMAIAGGEHISIISNKIYGRMQSFTNVGLYVNAIGGYKITDAVVKGNRIEFYNAKNYNNNWWLADQNNKPEGWDDGGNILGDKTLNESLLPKKIITRK